ncbi:Uncharacterised protein [Mycobacterium tuberculosis]|nr:Uncharacterised protein [Mycobacterium tuberculosis]
MPGSGNCAGFAMTEDALYLPDSSAATASIILKVEPGE